jgi:hypothetical protein
MLLSGCHVAGLRDVATHRMSSCRFEGAKVGDSVRWRAAAGLRDVAIHRLEIAWFEIQK